MDSCFEFFIFLFPRRSRRLCILMSFHTIFDLQEGGGGILFPASLYY